MTPAHRWPDPIRRRITSAEVSAHPIPLQITSADPSGRPIRPQISPAEPSADPIPSRITPAESSGEPIRVRISPADSSAEVIRVQIPPAEPSGRVIRRQISPPDASGEVIRKNISTGKFSSSADYPKRAFLTLSGNQGRDAALRCPVKSGRDGALRRPRRVQRRNVGRSSRQERTGSARCSAGGDIAARCPYQRRWGALETHPRVAAEVTRLILFRNRETIRVSSPRLLRGDTARSVLECTASIGSHGLYYKVHHMMSIA